MLSVDRLYLGNSFRYSRQSLQNRARLRNPNGWQWISIPLHSGQQGRAVARTAVNNNEPWMGRHWRALMFNYRSAPYFEYYEPRLKPIFDETWDTVGALTLATAQFVKEALDLSVELIPTTSLDGPPDSLESTLAQAAAGPLLVPASTRVHDGAVLEASDREIQVVHLDLPVYEQNFEGFESGMSVVDMLFNHGPATRQLLLEAREYTPYSAAVDSRAD